MYTDTKPGVVEKVGIMRYELHNQVCDIFWAMERQTHTSFDWRL